MDETGYTGSIATKSDGESVELCIAPGEAAQYVCIRLVAAYRQQPG